ncbi:MAG: carboxypeptidase-like regulatory domain-containing protein, partial [Thermoplasmata archaeon]
ITVSWRDIDVAEETIDVPTTENITVIECRVYHVEFHTVDDMDYNLTNARITVSHTDVGVLTSGITDEGGRVTTRLPGETLEVNVEWRGVNVYSENLVIDSSEYIKLACSVYYVDLHLVDDLALDLENARIIAVNVQTGELVRSGYSNMDGRITFRLPNGLHDITVSWRDIDVAEETIDVPTTENITVIECRVYHVEFHTVDDMDHDLENARITVSHADVGVLTSGTTDENGRVTLRLPGETFDLDVVWKGVNVYSDSEVIDSSGYIKLVCGVYYVDMHMVDDLALDLENARIVAVNVQTEELVSSGYSDMNGEITFRLPNGLHDITVSWRGTDVAEETIDVPTADSIVIECRVYHVEFHAVDGRDHDLENARITVSHADVGVLTSGTTDENGRVTLRLPGETLDVDAAWRGVNVYSENLVIDSSEYIKLACSVYYIDLHVVDDLEMDLENAYIELYHRGEILYSVTTGYDGVAPDVRLPSTNVDIHIYWKTIHLHSETIFVEQDGTETFSVPVYHVDFQVQDDLGEEISDARLDVYHGSILMHTDITCMDGTSYARIPHATNRVTLNWKSVLVYDQELNFDSSGTLLIEVADVYNVTLQSVDSRNISVESAVLRFYVNGYQFESGETDVNGTINLRVPTPVGAPGEIKIDIFWRGIQVYNQTITVDSHIFEDSPRLLDTEIYYVDYSVEDQQGVAVENAKAIGTHSELPDDNNIIADQITDEDGYILFRLPRGYQQLSVYWKDVLVGADSFELEDDTGIVVSSEVYYLTVTVTDDMNHPVESAHVRLTYADTPQLYEARYTDASGRVTIRIPVGSWDIEIHWLKTSVYEGNVQVDSSENSWSHAAAVDVYYLTVVTEDRKGEPLDDVHLKVSADDMMWTGYTEEGEHVFRLPARGDYELVASLRTTYLLSNVDLVESRQITLTEESSESVNFEEYPIEVYRTNLFMMILLIVVIIVVLVVVYSRLISSPGVDTVDEDTVDEDTVDEDTVDEDTVDEDTVDEDTVDEDTVDEEYVF